MTIELLKKYDLGDVQFVVSCNVLNEEMAAMLVIDKTDHYALYLVSLDGVRILPLHEIFGTFLDSDSGPVLFTIHDHFGVIKNRYELFMYSNIDSKPFRIEIKDKWLFGSVLPSKTRLCPQSPITNHADMLPICFQHTVFRGAESRYFAVLKINMDKKLAKWESWASINDKKLPVRGGVNPPKIDNIMVWNEEFFAFTSGSKITSVNKWGMDYYGIVQINGRGDITEILLDSGNLHLIDQKKRGVNGIFSSSGRYAILTPLFQSDEWKGKQKLFSMETKELLDIEFPRGFGKYAQILQFSNSYIWVYLPDKNQMAVCYERTGASH